MSKKSELQQAIDGIEEEIERLKMVRDRLLAVRREQPKRTRKQKPNVAEKQP